MWRRKRLLKRPRTGDSVHTGPRPEAQKQEKGKGKKKTVATTKNIETRIECRGSLNEDFQNGDIHQGHKHMPPSSGHGTLVFLGGIANVQP